MSDTDEVLELDYALNRISVEDSPAEVVHYFVGLGNVTLFKGILGEWDRMMRVGNQAWHHGLMPIINDPQALVRTLQEKFHVEPDPVPVAPHQTDLGQLSFWL